VLRAEWVGLRLKGFDFKLLIFLCSQDKVVFRQILNFLKGKNIFYILIKIVASYSFW